MKVAILILTYKNPEQLDELIEIMSIDEFTFFIHLDKKIDFTDFEFISKRKNVFFIKNRIKVIWGSYSMNNAIVEGLKEILSTDNYDNIGVIQSTHLPLKRPHEILNFLSENKEFQFFNFDHNNAESDWWKRCEKRILKYSLIAWKIPGKYKIEKIINSILPNRKFPKKYIIVGSPSSFFLTSECVKYLVNEYKINKELIKFFKYVWGPDEFLFATIIYNSKFKEKIKDCLVYIEFDHDNNGHSKIMQKNDYEKIKNSGKFFAKKFDPYVDSDIIKMVNNLRDGVSEIK